MDTLRQIGAGFLLAVISITLVLGGFVLSVTEGGKSNVQPSVIPSLPVTATILVVLEPSSTEMVVPTISQPPATLTVVMTVTQLPQLPTQTSTQFNTSTPPPTPASCTPPPGWVVVVVQSYDTLYSLAQTFQTTAKAIKDGNCLFSDQLIVGSFMYVPLRPTATYVPCGAPAGWVNYYVQPGDTLYQISLAYRVTVEQLQIANCLGSSTYIQAGKILKVPNVIPSTPVKTATPIWYVTATQIILPTVSVATPVDTAVPTPVDTPVPPPTTYP